MTELKDTLSRADAHMRNDLIATYHDVGAQKRHWPLLLQERVERRVSCINVSQYAPLVECVLHGQFVLRDISAEV